MRTEYTNQSEIPEPLRGEYEEKEGKWVLKIEGDVPGFVPAAQFSELTKKHAEFRDNNRALNSEVERLKAEQAKVEGVDVEEYKKLKEASEKAASGKTETERQLAAMSKQLEALAKKLEASEKREADGRAELGRERLTGTLRQAGVEAGVVETAMPDFIQRGLALFSLADDGKIVAMVDGVQQYNDQGGPMTPKDWAKRLAGEAQHLFKPSTGAGARPAPGGATSGTRVIAPDARLSAQDLADIASGKAVRGE